MSNRDRCTSCPLGIVGHPGAPVIALAQRRTASARRMMERSSLRAERGGERVARAFRLRAIMKQGTAASLPETWTHFPSIEEARAASHACGSCRAPAGAESGHHRRESLGVSVAATLSGACITRRWSRDAVDPERVHRSDLRIRHSQVVKRAFRCMQARDHFREVLATLRRHTCRASRPWRAGDGSNPAQSDKDFRNLDRVDGQYLGE